MDALERLVALEEIRDLIARYCISIDDYDWEDFEELWTEDAAFVVDDLAFEGREAVLELLTTCLPNDYTGKHMISPSRVQLGEDGTTAMAQTDVVWIAQSFETSIVARYNDSLVERDGRWLFQRRHETTVPFKPGLHRTPRPPAWPAGRQGGRSVRGVVIDCIRSRNRYDRPSQSARDAEGGSASRRRGEEAPTSE